MRDLADLAPPVVKTGGAQICEMAGDEGNSRTLSQVADLCTSCLWDRRCKIYEFSPKN